MTTSLRDRRRVERFAQLLDEADGARRQHLRSPLDDELADLVTLRHRLVAAPPPAGTDPEFRAGLRAMLLATAERDGVALTMSCEAPARPARTRPARGVRARTAVVAGVVAGTVAFAGMSAASENAVPGDPLYGVKRSTERAQLALASSDVGRGHLHLDFARTRLAEARALAGALGTVLDDMDRDTIEGVRLLTTAAADRRDPAPLDAIDDFAVGQSDALGALAGRAGSADLARISDSTALLDAIVTRTADLRRSIEACAGDAIVSIDALGPRPDDCVALPAPGVLLPPPVPAPAPDPPEQADDGTDRPDDDDGPVSRGGITRPPPGGEGGGPGNRP